MSTAMATAKRTTTRSTDLSGPVSIDVGLARIREELDLALQWKRPSIVLAVTKTGTVHRAARSMLQEWLELRGERVERFSVGRRDNGDVPMLISRKRLIGKTVYFIERIGMGGEDSVRALNMRREYFVDRQVRAVFWLDENEEKAIAQLAPDFWAFRHLVVYFG